MPGQDAWQVGSGGAAVYVGVRRETDRRTQQLSSGGAPTLRRDAGRRRSRHPASTAVRSPSPSNLTGPEAASSSSISRAQIRPAVAATAAVGRCNGRVTPMAAPAPHPAPGGGQDQPLAPHEGAGPGEI
jgi:hypothetical protein